ncbi:UV DNA damage repair endonuclease UvsE [Planococcus liqunii]|uniref:UV DNA damage repair endonuclease UvsE n=1 Tax=Planococcus liqunii TaxID=3058394 RepID=A0ABT8MN25_9BACL|nr:MULTISPECIES: UV DNA damage repair endonuclease UvsE [unclassified Planococcus (in: firmicutes)]MDN7226297.1 UV DNA damage repair endonuclease UvsE [Planococcus sp. N064]WKA50074.1 UV DNA damage repair endonuclease UvsE [Planococcus sp. N056]
MRLGYACMNTELKTVFRTLRLATVEAEGTAKIKELTLKNMQTTLEIIQWNIENNIFFYRASSSMIPLSTHPVNDWIWWEDPDFLDIAEQIRLLVEASQMRVSMHPGQYTVLNSPKPEVVKKSIEDLEYHDRLIQLLGGNDLILHTGGAYGDKESAKARFAENYLNLSNSIKRRLRLENDDKTFTVRDVLDVNKMCGVPVCFDIHHHNCNNDGKPVDFAEILATWEGFGIPKIHISTGKEGFTDLRHHDLVSETDFNELLLLLGDTDADIMFEAKLKEQAVLPFVKQLAQK